ncbi:hypothetical protein B0H16DRAFT_1757487 [Mycena metata]|uniref:Uncharacterized protein n=1 Tax=Mycena metata TaxID=1033252 RepID=A0AAD7IDR7_9AGAR|nr:hypothetical protein B0H16DRAFT_1757487 [Mycena metata]
MITLRLPASNPLQDPILIQPHLSCDILPPDRLLLTSKFCAGAERLPVECPQNPTDTQFTLTPSTAYTIPSSRHVSVSAAMMDVPSPAVPVRPRLREMKCSTNELSTGAAAAVFDLPSGLPPSRARLPSYTASCTHPLAFLPPAYIRIRLQNKPLTVLFCFSHIPSASLPSQNPNRTSSTFCVPSRYILYSTSPAARVFLQRRDASLAFTHSHHAQSHGRVSFLKLRHVHVFFKVLNRARLLVL